MNGGGGLPPGRKTSPSGLGGGAGTGAASSSMPRVTLWSWFDLPVDPRSRELSGIAWDDATRTMWAVQDESPTIVGLVPDAELRTWRFGPTITVRTNDPLDLEGIVVVPLSSSARGGRGAPGDRGFVLASEVGPRLLEVDREGVVRGDIALPAKLGEARHNKSLESLAASRGGELLFTMTEDALPRDVPRAAAIGGGSGSRLRLIRIERATGATAEFEYVADADASGASDHGVSDLEALSDDDVLVLERGFARGRGNIARIYRVDLRGGGAECTTIDRLDDTSRSLDKRLLVDLATLPTDGVPAPRQEQSTPLLDNYEGLALGPRLPDGRRCLVLVSDDNGRREQTARILVLALG